MVAKQAEVAKDIDLPSQPIHGISVLIPLMKSMVA
jgi:hypothetical protein